MGLFNRAVSKSEESFNSFFDQKVGLNDDKKKMLSIAFVIAQSLNVFLIIRQVSHVFQYVLSGSVFSCAFAGVGLALAVDSFLIFNASLRWYELRGFNAGLLSLVSGGNSEKIKMVLDQLIAKCVLIPKIRNVCQIIVKD
ncbi:MAG TPA: hypothetical protein P5048_01160 [Chlamydiales bacterium]|nr:hypothetical protein [Chlamydiales bacterium]